MDDLEKTSASDIHVRGDVERLPDAELLQLHRRLHQWYANTHDKAEFAYYQLHAWVVDEMHKRGMSHHEVDGLDAEVPNSIARGAALEDYVLVPDYVCVVGSATAAGTPNDVDILLREDERAVSKGWRESVMLLVRKVLDVGKRIHILCNETGPHLAPGQRYLPLFDLILRPKQGVAKGASELPGWRQWLNKAPDGMRVDIGSGPDGPPAGFVSLDRPTDLEEPWPLEDESVAVLRANHVLEHLESPAHAMNEIWRVLKPGGVAVITVPDAASAGAAAHPEHKSFWVPESFLFWTKPELLSTVEQATPTPFNLLYLARREDGGLAYVDAVLQKPGAVEKAALKPIMHFTPPKPAMKGRMHTEAFAPEQIADWFQKHKDAGVFVEPKLNGFRSVLQSDGKRVSLFFEDSQKERWPVLSQFLNAGAIEKLPPFILDCDVGVVQNDRRWPRVRIMTLTADEPDLPDGAAVQVTAFDLVYWNDEEVAALPFAERRKRLEAIASMLKKASIDITPCKPVDDLDAVAAAWRSAEFGRAPMSEGIVLKAGDWPYESQPATDGMAKIKHALELKLIVLDATTAANGQKHYTVGLLPGKRGGGEVEFRGRKYVSVGDTLNTPINAQPGDIITVEVEELVVDDEKLAILDGKVLDIDRERDEPYYAQQAVDLAQRAHVLNDKSAGAGVEKAAEPEGEGGETRAEAANKHWHEAWHEAIPVSGRPQPYILHMHWRGLTADEAKQSLDDLLKTDNSVHYDLRLGTDRFNGWWGFSLFAGRAADNRPRLRVERMQTDPEERLEGAPKQFGPRGWLKVGVPEPLVVEPGGVGSTSRAWSKFFAIDRGTYRVGMAREHAIELWFDGDILKGRHMLQYARIGGERAWLLTKPEDQRPYAETHNKDDVLADVGRKGQKALFWPKDGDYHKGLEKLTPTAKSIEYRIIKANYPNRVTIGVIYPANEVDAHGDWASKEEIEKACWRFNRKLRTGEARVGLFHRPELDYQGEIIESAIYRGPDYEENGQVIRNGSWLGAIQWRPEAFDLIVKGKVTGLSIQGFAAKEG